MRNPLHLGLSPEGSRILHHTTTIHLHLPTPCNLTKSPQTLQQPKMCNMLSHPTQTHHPSSTHKADIQHHAKHHLQRPQHHIHANMQHMWTHVRRENPHHPIWKDATPLQCLRKHKMQKMAPLQTFPKTKPRLLQRRKNNTPRKMREEIYCRERETVDTKIGHPETPRTQHLTLITQRVNNGQEIPEEIPEEIPHFLLQF